MKIKYGLLEKNVIDVTDICHNKLKTEQFISIPPGDSSRSINFGDPVPYVVKKMYIEKDDGILLEFDQYLSININLQNNIITTTAEVNEEIKKIQESLILLHGNFNDELPEQKMSLKYLKGDEKVLEIGANIGRNTLIISHILGENSHNLVTMECDVNISKQLLDNKIINNKNFQIETAALSKKKLIQQKGAWAPIPTVSNELPEGYYRVNTITLNELSSKYDIQFDTLVLDCEGSFYYILLDMPEILDGIKLIIMENDYFDINKKNFVDEILKKNNFYLEYVESGGWGPCFKNFYEVWKRN